VEKTIQNLIDFHKKAEKLKLTTRHSWLTDPSRQESTAEHSWMLCLLAIILSDKLDAKVDLLKVLKIVIVHDLAESVTGDIPAHEVSARQENKYSAEKKAFETLLKDLPCEKGEEIISLWEEFEKRETAEAKFADSLDKIEAIMQHNLADIKTWNQGDFNVHPYYKDDRFDFDAFMRKFKDVADDQSMKKIIAAKAESRIDPKHLETYAAKNIKK
jgi:putative hydrolases of HD superfamily